jgi:hypothetical protein
MHLLPLLDLWDRGKKEGVIKSVSNYLLYAYAINPLSFLLMSENRGAFKIDKTIIDHAFSAAWDSIKT